MNGKVIFKTSISVNGNEYMVNIQDKLTSGVYCVKLYSSNAIETKTVLID